MLSRSSPLALLFAGALALSSCGYDDSDYDSLPEDGSGPGAPTPGANPSPVPCTTALECDDGDACTTDACDAGFCRSTPIVGCTIPAPI